MTDLLKRLARIARANIPNPNEWLDRWTERRGHWFDPNAENKAGEGEAGRFRSEEDFHAGNRGRENPTAGVPRQVVEDLAVFGLTPPSSLEEVRKARNREIKKYHSDRFVNDSERYETSKQIMQIYNAAYDRLKEHFEARKGNP
ncbi:MAG: J domain-containing protein [Desulfococcaceae bacterium]